MIKVGIIGSTGYAGQELIRLLLGHKEVEIVWCSSRTYVNKKYSEVYPNMYKLIDEECIDDNILELAKEVDLIYMATPHGYSSSIINDELLSQVKIIDLSADFRIQNKDVYEEWYKTKHESFAYTKEAIYGLCELNRHKIKESRLIANPGCYPTCTILTVYPLLKEGLLDESSIIIDAKSGVSGAGRGLGLANLYCEANESVKAYAIASHRHTPEIEEQLSNLAKKEICTSFTPHLIPMNRGILITAYASLVKSVSDEEIKEIYEKYYKDERFIRLLDKGAYPETRWVEGSNYVDINFKVDPRANRVVMVGAMDNLVKGAAGQALQNMNIMFGLDEWEGLKIVPLFP